MLKFFLILTDTIVQILHPKPMYQLTKVIYRDYLMNKLNIISFALIFMLGFSATSFAAGDYVWEEKFKKALPKAEQGDAKAQYTVGEMYEKGKGAVKDLQKAFDWYAKSAEQDNKKAAYKVGLAYLEGAGVKKNYSKAHKWLKKSADKKYVRAEYYLGVMYENGQGVGKDYDEALKWYKAALAGGYGSASDGIERVSNAQRASDRRARAAAARSEPKPKPVETCSKTQTSSQTKTANNQRKSFGRRLEKT
jgi:TPR repeat protein